MPSATVYCEQPAPVCQSHHSTVHGLPSLVQVTPVPAWQLPPLHESFCVHTLPSLQAPVRTVCAQYVVGEQLSSVQELLSSQFW